jgi:hypothetical protein
MVLGVSEPHKYRVNAEDGEKAAEKFQTYLNSPMGKVVLDTIVEGEVFTIENQEHILQIKKQKGQCFVDFVGYVEDKKQF